MRLYLFITFECCNNVLKSSDNWIDSKRIVTVERRLILITVITSCTLGKYLEFSFI